MLVCLSGSPTLCLPVCVSVCLSMSDIFRIKKYHVIALLYVCVSSPLNFSLLSITPPRLIYPSPSLPLSAVPHPSSSLSSVSLSLPLFYPPPLLVVFPRLSLPLCYSSPLLVSFLGLSLLSLTPPSLFPPSLFLFAIHHPSSSLSSISLCLTLPKIKISRWMRLR